MSSALDSEDLPNQGVLLASASPRRLELLRQMGLPAVARPAAVDERITPGEAPSAYVARLSVAKGDWAYERYRHWLESGSAHRVILAADTIVVLDNRVLGKPGDQAAAEAMLRALSGATHQVLTSVTVFSAVAVRSAVCRTVVRFRPLSERDIAAYVRTAEGSDKAGSYGIQGIGGIFAEHISGSYSAVVGLPIATVEELLGQLGIDTWRLRGYD